jgi:hypothetical protein
MTIKTNKNKIVPIRPNDPFTEDARKRWNKVPEWAQAKILSNVFCGKCLKSVSVVLERGKMHRDDLILIGKCKICGHEVRRLVESENV